MAYFRTIYRHSNKTGKPEKPLTTLIASVCHIHKQDKTASKQKMQINYFLHINNKWDLYRQPRARIKHGKGQRMTPMCIRTKQQADKPATLRKRFCGCWRKYTLSRLTLLNLGTQTKGGTGSVMMVHFQCNHTLLEALNQGSRRAQPCWNWPIIRGNVPPIVSTPILSKVRLIFKSKLWEHLPVSAYVPYVNYGKPF